MAPPSRNAPCPCGSGKRYKYCCGDTWRANAPASATPRPAPAAPVLSVILPFYRKLAEFRRVLPENARWLARDGLEVVIAMDDPTDEAALVAFLRDFPQIRWKVVVNDEAHAWRPPCRAINVGLRHAKGTYVFIASPESAFAGDAPGMALDAVKDFPGGIAIGRVEFATFGHLASGFGIADLFAGVAQPSPSIDSFYGSVCGPRAAFVAVGGYDESLAGWGADDTNLRVRLEMSGQTILACDDVRLLHLSFEPRRDHTNPEHVYDAAAALIKASPVAAEANLDTGWGTAFARVAFAHPARLAKAGDARALDDAPPTVAPLSGSVVPTRSLRRCRACGRRLYHQPPASGCAVCASAPAVRAIRRPRIAAVLQLRNEEYYLPGCLDHLRGRVDAILALDDGSTDATAELLARESGLADRLANPPSADHVWRERENRRRLLERARELGFDWVLCCDADERYEASFLTRLHDLAASFPRQELVAVSIAFKELWDGPGQFREDGIWGGKTRSRFFPVPARIAYDLDSDLHGQWYPDHLRKYGRKIALDARLYHLRMIRREDRITRRDRYLALDPGRQFQASGYEYLADEPAGLVVKPIERGREYDYATLPGDLRD